MERLLCPRARGTTNRFKIKVQLIKKWIKKITDKNSGYKPVVFGLLIYIIHGNGFNEWEWIIKMIFIGFLIA